jgi:hypothetical protein
LSSRSSAEQTAALQQTVPEAAAVFNRILLNATEAEREAVINALKGRK